MSNFKNPKHRLPKTQTTQNTNKDQKHKLSKHKPNCSRYLFVLCVSSMFVFCVLVPVLCALFRLWFLYSVFLKHWDLIRLITVLKLLSSLLLQINLFFSQKACLRVQFFLFPRSLKIYHNHLTLILILEFDNAWE